MRASRIALVMLLVGACQAREMSPEARSLLWSFQENYERGRYVAALAYLDSALEREPTMPRLHYLRGDVLTTLYRFDAAEASFRRALDLESRYPSAAYRIANNAFFLGQNRKALIYYEKEQRALGRSADSTTTSAIWAQIGRVYARLGKADSARWAYGHSLEAAATDGQVYAWIAELEEVAGQHEEALEHVQRALELESDVPAYHYLAGALLQRLGRLEEAVDHLQIAVEGTPWHAGAHYNLGRSLLALGRAAEGQRYLDATDSLQALEADIVLARFAAQNRPNEQQPWITLSLLLDQSGQTAEARQAWRVAQQVGAKNE